MTVNSPLSLQKISDKPALHEGALSRTLMRITWGSPIEWTHFAFFTIKSKVNVIQRDIWNTENIFVGFSLKSKIKIIYKNIFFGEFLFLRTHSSDKSLWDLEWNSLIIGREVLNKNILYLFGSKNFLFRSLQMKYYIIPLAFNQKAWIHE